MNMPILAIFLLAMLAGYCTTNGVGAEPHVEYKTKIMDSACKWMTPIYVPKADVLADETAAAILAHNRSGAKVCGWKPRGKQGAQKMGMKWCGRLCSITKLPPQNS